MRPDHVATVLGIFVAASVAPAACVSSQNAPDGGLAFDSGTTTEDGSNVDVVGNPPVDASDSGPGLDASDSASSSGLDAASQADSSPDGGPFCSDPSLATDLLAYYTFATDFSDSSGHGLNASGTNVSAAAGVPTLPGNAYSFNGSNSSIAITGSYALSGARTMCMWVNPGATSGEPLFVGGANGAGDMIGIGASGLPCSPASNDLLFLDHWNGGDCRNATGVTVPSGQWDFVCLAYDGSSTVTLYSNGSSATASQSLYDYNLDTVTIGANGIGGTSTSASLTGAIADVGIWTQALTVAQMNELYDGGSGCRE